MASVVCWWVAGGTREAVVFRVVAGEAGSWECSGGGVNQVLGVRKRVDVI